MADRQFEDPDLAGLYDLFHPWEAREDLAFYLPLVLSADAVLDVGCGTGMLLHRARDAGHTGRLCGLDPALGMLDHARERTGIEWVHGDVSGVARDRAFDLIVMSGHAFQVFLTDDELHSSLAAISNALDDDGRFAFETRNPFARAWEEWTPENAVEASDASGAKVRMTHHVDLPVTGELVRFTTTYSSPAWDRPRMSRSTLRFLDAESLSSFLPGAGLAIEEQFGDWAASR
ncbi:MAG TPA: methyltransferase domain-containing protein [Acidimicrobiia bacterium]|nr:methyltransferase domain-containing protein [Acidimicrobiia bacterium]